MTVEDLKTIDSGEKEGVMFWRGVYLGKREGEEDRCERKEGLSVSRLP